MGIVARYVLPIYHQGLLQPAAGRVSAQRGRTAPPRRTRAFIVGIGGQTILGDMTLRLSRASFAPGDIQTVYFWRDGQYYTTEMMRPET